GGQAPISLLSGWHPPEGHHRALFGKQETTAAPFAHTARTPFGDNAGEFLKLYPAGTDEEARRSAQDMAGDQFIAYSTWKWLELQSSTPGVTVYRYEFDDAPPRSADDKNPDPPAAYHSAEIEFVFEALD